jgi:hypothetical protein
MANLEKAHAACKELWKDPEYRAKMVKVSTEARKKAKATTIRKWATDKGYRRFMTETMASYFRSNEFRQLMSDLWSTPEYKETVSAAISEGMIRYWKRRKAGW